MANNFNNLIALLSAYNQKTTGRVLFFCKVGFDLVSGEIASSRPTD